MSGLVVLPFGVRSTRIFTQHAGSALAGTVSPMTQNCGRRHFYPQHGIGIHSNGSAEQRKPAAGQKQCTTEQPECGEHDAL